jgi:ABC-2 type transport system permease protein
MKPVFYEIERSLTSKFSIVMIVVIIGLSALISYEGGALSSARSVRGGGVSEVSGYYADGNNLTLISYFYDINGNPDNVRVNASLNNTVYPGSEISAGLFEFHIITQSPVSIVDLNYSYKQFGFTTSNLAAVAINTATQNFSGLSIVPGILDSSNSSDLGFLLFYVGEKGNHTSPPISVFLGPITSEKLNISSFTANYTWKNQYSNFTYLTIFPNLGATAIGKSYGVLVDNSTPSMPPIYKFQPIGPLSDFTPYTASAIESSFFSAEGSLLILFIPLLAVFMAYFTYGKDRVTGVLESVIKRPITKGEAIRSRFLANSVVVSASIVVAIVISDLISYRYFHVYMPLSFLLYVSWAYSIVGISFVAISYLFSHMLKSQGALLGSLIGIFMVFSLFWSVIFDVLVSVFSIPSGTSTYITFQVAFNYASPAGYSSLVQLYITHALGGFISFSGGSQSINPLAYGVTPVLLLIAGILWVAVPFTIAHQLAVKRD